MRKTANECSPWINGKFRVGNAGANAKLLEIKLDFVAPLDAVDEEDAFSLDQLQLQHGVNQDKFFRLVALDVILD